MKNIPRIVVLFLAVVCFNSLSLADSSTAVSKDKEMEIRRMLQITGMAHMMDQMVDQMLASINANSPGNTPPEVLSKLREKMKVQDLIDLIVPVYARHFSLDDLRAVNAFYSTPAGQRILAETPKIMQETMQIGQQWGIRAAQEAQAELPSANGQKP